MEHVKLKAIQKLHFYFFPFLMFSFSLIGLFFLLTRNDDYSFSKQLILSILFFFLLGIAAAIKQYLSLQYYIIKTDQPIAIKRKIIKDILKKCNWKITKDNYNFIQAEGNGFSSKIDFRTWFDLMTFEIFSEEIKINSIPNPDDWGGQPLSFGKNRQNIKDFEILFLNEASQVEK
jgi:hypothetical protein